MIGSSRPSFIILAFGILCVLAMAQITHSPGRHPVSPLSKPASLERQFVKGKRGPRSDKPAEAQEYFRAKRAPVGETAIPVERYLSAKRQMRNMPVYSTASDLMAPAGLAAAATQALGTWEELGPGNVGGRTRALVFDPGDANVIYAGGVAGGVWKSTNGGLSWSALDDLMANLAVASLAIDPNNSSVLYAGTGEGVFNFDAVRGAGIFKTTDGGATWIHLASTNNSSFYYVNDVVVSPNSSQRVYAATRTGVWRSANAGTSWSQVLSVETSNGCLDLTIRTDSANDVVFASCGGTFDDATVYQNLDAGGGGAWSASLTEAGLGRTSLAIAPSDQDVIYALSASRVSGQFFYGLHAVFRSTDGGASWVARVRNTDPVPMNRMLLTNSWFALCSSSIFNQGWYDNVIAVDPMDSDIVWTGGVDLFRSDDGGQNWGYAGRNAHVDQHALAFPPDYDGVSNTTLYVGNDGGVYRTLNSRAGTDLNICSGPSSVVVWSSLNNNYGVTQFYHGAPYPDGQTYFGGTQDNGTVRGNDTGGAQNWQPIMGGDGGYVAVDPTNTNVLYAEFQNWAIRKSTNGGASFSSATNGISDSGLFITPFIMDPSNSQRLWTGGRFAWRTVNGASNWVQASSQLGSTVSALAVSPTNPNRVLVGLTSGRIHRTDVGLSASSATVWPSTRPRSGFVSSLAFHPEDEMTAYATYSTFGGVHVWMSTNGGTSWTDLDGSGSTGIPDIPSHSIVVDPVAAPVGSHLYVSTDLGVFTSIDAGATWAVENTGFANVVTETLALDASQSKLFAFTHGRGAFRVDLLQGNITPRAPSPVDGAVDVDHTPTLTWIAGASTYDVYFGTSPNPPLVSSNQIESSFQPGTLGLTTPYYWKVVSRDSLGAEVPGPEWSFTTAAQCSERVMDGGFEGGAASPAWAQVSTNFGTPLCDPNTCGVVAARTGDWWIWFGGTSVPEQGSVGQTVSLPLGAATLSFYLWINISSGNGVDNMRVLIDGQEIFAALEGDSTYTGGYAPVVLNVDDFADGGTHTLRFESTTTGSPVGSNFFVDDVSLTGCVGLLSPPNLVSPLVDATNDTTPTFEWSAVTDAVSYRLLVDNLTSGGTPIDITTSGTSFTPGSALAAAKFYQWRVQALDAGAIPGPFSPPITFELDTQAPPAVTLSAQLPSGLTNVSNLTAIDASSEWTSNGGAKTNIVDGDPATKWQSTSKSTVTTEFVTIDLGSTLPVGRIRLLASANENPLLFPKGFELQVSDLPDANFTTVRTEANFVAQQGMWYDFDASPVLSGRYVRIWITDTNFYVNNFPYNALIAEVEVLEDSPSFGTIVYSWEAPADDAGGGTEPVVTYDLRIRTSQYPYDYNQAYQILNEPTPVLGGTQTVTVSGLPNEKSFGAALTSIDDAGNRSALSNVIHLATPGIPPAVITNLRAFSPAKTSMELDWDAPTEDGSFGGKVASYEVRYSEAPIGAGNFASAMLVTDETPPAPQDPGTTQSMTVNNLDPSTHYYFAIISRDDVGNVSAPSNNAQMATLDGTPPAAIADLQAASGGGALIEVKPLAAANSSGVLSGFDAGKTVDDNENTYWSSPGVKPMRIEYVTIDMGSVVEVARVRLLSSNQSPLLFAKSFDIQVGNDPQVNFATGLTVPNFVATSATWYSFDLPNPISGRYVRIRVTEMNQYSNKKYYAQLAEIEVFSQAPATNGVMLQWTAPGDDLNVGTASKYLVHYATSEILDDDDFDNATPVPDQDVPAPQAAGSPEMLMLTALPPEQLLWFAIKTEDENSNLSPLSNVVQISTPGTPPGPITGLQVLNGLATGSSITLEFVEPPNDAGDNGSGPVDHYQVGCSTAAIGGVGDFEALAPFDPGPTPVGPGNTLEFEVTGLANQTSYNCAIRAVDPGGLMSDLSVVVSGSTLDEVAPAQVSNFGVGFASTPVSLFVENSSGAISPEANVLDASPSTSWISPGVKQHRQEWITLDLGAEASLGQVRLLSSNQSVALFPRSFKLQVGNDPNNNFNDALTVTGFVATASTWYSFNFAPISGRYVRVLVTEMNLYSNGKFYAALAGVEASEAGGPDVDATLTWTAPGDDGNTGTASSYEIRYDTEVITGANFDGAMLAASGLAPKSPGSSETFAIGGLLPGTLYYFAIKTSDEAGNPSFSIISATTP